MKKVLYIAILSAASISGVGCRHAVSGDSLMAYMADPSHGLIQQMSSKDMHVTAQYLPTAYQLWRDVRTGDIRSESEADSAERDYDRFLYFRILIRPQTVNHSLSNYYNFDIRSEFTMIAGKDTMACSLCERITNGNEAINEYVLAFPRTGEVASATGSRFRHGVIILYSRFLLGLPPLTFEFSRKELNRIPKLKI